jgi:hypothetical protein
MIARTGSFTLIQRVTLLVNAGAPTCISLSHRRPLSSVGWSRMEPAGSRQLIDHTLIRCRVTHRGHCLGVPLPDHEIGQRPWAAQQAGARPSAVGSECLGGRQAEKGARMVHGTCSAGRRVARACRRRGVASPLTTPLASQHTDPTGRGRRVSHDWHDQASPGGFSTLAPPRS